MACAHLRSAWDCISSSIGNKEAHRTSMLLAFVFSSAFLISYIVNHAMHGDTIFPGHGAVRALYLSILASHVILSIVALPMVLTTFFFSLTARFAPPDRTREISYSALCFSQWRGGFRLPQGLCLLDPAAAKATLGASTSASAQAVLLLTLYERVVHLLIFKGRKLGRRRASGIRRAAAQDRRRPISLASCPLSATSARCHE